MTSHSRDSVERKGFAVVPNLLTESLRRELVALFHGQAGQRNGLAFEAVRAAATSDAVRAVVQSILGVGSFAIKATLFHKTASANWLVPLHQDVTIPVREQRETPGFGAWSTKDGVPHVRPPLPVLESMLAVRLDLDGTDDSNGPLQVVPGSHKRGLLTAAEIQNTRRDEPPVACLVPKSGGLIMRPLLLHASSRATAPDNRRIVHLEFAKGSLGGGLRWYERIALGDPRRGATGDLDL